MSSALGQALRCFSAGRMGDALFNHGAVHIVGAEQQGHLRYFQARHDPVGLDMVEVVQKEPRCGKQPELLECRGPVAAGKLGVGGMKRQGNEGLKAAGLVLKIAQAQEMIGNLFIGFDMAPQKGRI